MPSGRTLGYWVNGETGLVTLPSDSLVDLVSFTAFVLSRPSSIPLKLLEVLLGRWMPYLTLRRELMSSFSAVWRDMHASPFSGLSHDASAELLLALCVLLLTAINFRISCSPLVAASDASSSGCGVCRSVGLSLEGRAALSESDRPLISSGLRIGLVELFAGNGGLRRSVELLGLSPVVSVVSEVDPAAIRVLLHQWPDSILWGDVSEISRDHVLSLARSSNPVDVWVIGGGFECQPFFRS